MAQSQVCLQLRPAQIEIAVLKTQVLACKCVTRSIQLKWWGTSIVKQEQLPRVHFNITGGDFWIPGVLVASYNFTRHSNHILTAYVFGFCMSGCVFRIENYLSDSISIA